MVSQDQERQRLHANCSCLKRAIAINKKAYQSAGWPADRPAASSGSDANPDSAPGDTKQAARLAVKQASKQAAARMPTWTLRQEWGDGRAVAWVTDSGGGVGDRLSQVGSQ